MQCYRWLQECLKRQETCIVTQAAGYRISISWVFFYESLFFICSWTFSFFFLGTRWRWSRARHGYRPTGIVCLRNRQADNAESFPSLIFFLKKIKDFFFFFLQNCSGFISCVGNRPHLNTSRFRLKQLSARINTITEALGVSSGVPPHPTFNPVF